MNIPWVARVYIEVNAAMYGFVVSVCLSILSVCERTGNGLDKGPPAHQSISHRESTPNGQIWKRKRKGEYRKEIAERRLQKVGCGE